MKSLSTNTFFFLAAALFFGSCKKDIAGSSNNLPLSSDQVSEADLPGIYKTPSGDIKLVLQPASDVSHDAWIEYSPTDASYATHNSNGADELHTLAWTDNGVVVIQRSLLQFDGLSQIPTNATVKQATLYLYGLTSSTQLPQGNSYYSGSPYYNYGPNDSYVQKITSPWSEKTVTWNTIPSFTLTNESLIPPSTKQWGNNTSADVTKIVRTIVQKPLSNHGFMLSLTNENIYHSFGFYASETTTASKRPKIVITYQTN